MLILLRNDNPLGRTGAGTVYVIYGKASLPSVIELPNITSSDGFVLLGPHAQASGTYGSVKIVPDINGDGLDEVFVSFGYDDALGRGVSSGSGYIIYGSKSSPGTIDLLNITPTQGVLIAGDVGYLLGEHTGFCDVNGDGTIDFLLSATGASSTGGAFLIYGNSSLPSIIDTK